MAFIHGFGPILILWIFGGMNNNVLDHIWWNFNCEGKNGGNNGGVMMYNYVLNHGDLGEHFWC